MKNIVKIIYVISLAAIFFTACEFGFDTRPEIAAPEFIPVQTIIGIPTGSLPYVNIPLSSAVVMPENATNKRIEWSIANDGGTNSKLDEGNRLSADNEGTITIKAVIKDGLGEDENYTQDFSIRISIRLAVPVDWISGIPATLTMGTYTLQGIIKPSDALNQTITWSVANAGTTGGSIYGNVLTTTSSGNVVLTATIFNGLIDKDYTQDFEITVYRPIYASGSYTMGKPDPDKACYWIDKERIDLAGVPTGKISYTSGVVFAGDKMYISGEYGGEYILVPNPYWDDYEETSATTACYWVVDETTGPGGQLHILDSVTSLGGDAIKTMSIAVDGTTVYITGRTLTEPSNYSYYLWKIHGNGDVTRTTLTNPGFQWYNMQYSGQLAVSGGKVYIPFYSSSYPYKSYYWDETGTYHPLAGSSPSYAATSAAIINGSVYFAGFMEFGPPAGYSYWYKEPSYLIMGHEPVSFNAASFLDSGTPGSGENVGAVQSIIVQNGKIWFYAARTDTSSPTRYRFDTEGNQERLPENNYGSSYDPSIVVYSDGDVYIALSGSKVGYLVVGKYLRILGGEEFGLPPEGKITGIVIR